MRTEIGHFSITYNDHDYELIPSFKNIRKICSPSEMPEFFAAIFGRDVNDSIQLLGENKHINDVAKKIIYSKINDLHDKASLVIQCCCDDDTSKLTGCPSYSKGRKAWRSGVMDHENMILIARAMLTHGVIGKIDKDSKQSGEETVDSIDVYKYVEFAVTDFGMTYERAESLTKTEFDRLFDSKYPEVKKSRKKKTTLEDHKHNMQVLAEINKRREAAKAANNG